MKRRPGPTWLRLGLPILVLGLFFAVTLQQVWTFGQRPEVVAGTLVNVTTWSNKHGTNFALVLSDGRRLTWTCGGSDCRHKQEQVNALRWETPLAVTLQVHDTELVGLTAREVEIVAPELDAPRQTKGMLALLAGGVFLAAIALINFFQHRPRRRRAAQRQGNVGL